MLIEWAEKRKLGGRKHGEFKEFTQLLRCRYRVLSVGSHRRRGNFCRNGGEVGAGFEPPEKGYTHCIIRLAGALHIVIENESAMLERDDKGMTIDWDYRNQESSENKTGSGEPQDWKEGRYPTT